MTFFMHDDSMADFDSWVRFRIISRKRVQPIETNEQKCFRCRENLSLFYVVFGGWEEGVCVCVLGFSNLSDYDYVSTLAGRLFEVHIKNEMR